MPVREDHEYTDKAHELTIKRAGWVYGGCHSSIVGDKPRGGPGTYLVPDGYIEVEQEDGTVIRQIKMRWHTTHWLSTHADGRPLKCGHLEELRLKDPQCIGCANRE